MNTFGEVVWRNDFDALENLPTVDQLMHKSQPGYFYPKIYDDNRGSFSESLVTDKNISKQTPFKIDFANLRQINRSSSALGVCRGFHAQRYPYTQGKLVEVLSDTPVWDIIIDARPESSTFNRYMMIYLSNKKMTKFWVPRGFLHAFIVVNSDFDGNGMKPCVNHGEFQYFVDNDYDKDSEIVIRPASILPFIIKNETDTLKSKPVQEQAEKLSLLKTVADSLVYSDKDTNGISYEEFIKTEQKKYEDTGRSWWR